MTEELDVNKVAAYVVQEQIDALVERVTTAGRSMSDSVRLQLKSSFKSYINTLLTRHLMTKSFFVRTKPVLIYTFYVPVSLRIGKTIIPNATMPALVADYNHVILVGGAGCGKSILLKHLLIGCIRKADKIPILVELRGLDKQAPDLLEALYASMRENGLAASKEFVKKGLADGQFSLLLDGLDEVPFSAREAVGNQIRKLTKKYPHCDVILTSRPEEELDGWSGFAVAKICPLDVNQAVELVSKLDVDSVIKKKFLAELPNGLFARHQSFLSNPLLLSIMLLSYAQSATIPTKLHIFYSNAYEALFQRHDALKEGFARKRLTMLDIQDFASVFAAFSMVSYDSSSYEFSESQALAMLQRAQPFCHCQFDGSDFLADAMQAVCLLLRDGLTITYTHRSFQEYFAARFIRDAEPEIQKKLIVRYRERAMQDNLYNLIMEMSPGVLEKHFVIPFANEVRAITGEGDSIGYDGYLRVLSRAVSQIRLLDVAGGKRVFCLPKDIGFLATLQWVYRSYVMVSLSNSKAGSEAVFFGALEGYGHRFALSELKPDDPAIHVLASSKWWLSKKTIEAIVLLGDHLARERDDRVAAIDDVFGGGM